MQNYTGSAEEVKAGTLFASPPECHNFLAKGQITVTEFIRHHSSLAYAGLWKWTDPQFETALKDTVGIKYFRLMAKIDMKNLNDLVSSSLRQNVKYLDYSTECKLRKLLQKEKIYGPDGRMAREELNNHREFYNEWGKLLFGESKMMEVEAELLVTATSSPTATPTAVPSSAAERLCGVIWVVIGSFFYFLI